MKTVIFLFALLTGSAAHARSWHRYPPGCTGTESREHVVSESSVVTGDCRQTAENKLGRISHVYPAMGGARLTVDYWQGSYGYPVRVRRLIEVNVYSCKGVLQNSYQRIDEFDSTVDYGVDNPNLHDDVSQSFIATAPMTDAEAHAALSAAAAVCARAHTGAVEHAMEAETR